MTGLVERLRKTEGGVLAEPYINPDGPEAADRIKALEAALNKVHASLRGRGERKRARAVLKARSER
jgi:hypothetical protein